MPSLGMPELLVILGVVVLLFGGKKLPELGGALGTSIRNFKKGLKDGEDALKGEPTTPSRLEQPKSGANQEPPKTPPQA